MPIWLLRTSDYHYAIVYQCHTGILERIDNFYNLSNVNGIQTLSSMFYYYGRLIGLNIWNFQLKRSSAKFTTKITSKLAKF